MTNDAKVKKMLEAFGMLVCGMLRKHKWGRPFPGDRMAHPDQTTWCKICRRCGAGAPVKRRVKKEKA